MTRGFACWNGMEPGFGSGVCSLTGRNGMVVPRRIAGVGYRWFVFTPTRYTTLTVGNRSYRLQDGIASFTTPSKAPGAMVAHDGSASFAVRVPRVGSARP